MVWLTGGCRRSHPLGRRSMPSDGVPALLMAMKRQELGRDRDYHAPQDGRGHGLSARRSEDAVPVVYVELTEAEEQLVLLGPAVGLHQL